MQQSRTMNVGRLMKVAVCRILYAFQMKQYVQLNVKQKAVVGIGAIELLSHG